MFRQYKGVNDRTLDDQLRRYVTSGQNDLAVVAMAEKLSRMADQVQTLQGKVNAQQEEIELLHKSQSKPAPKKQTKKAAQPKSESEEASNGVDEGKENE